MKFFEKLVNFSKQARKTLIEEYPGENISPGFLGYFGNTVINIQKFGSFVILCYKVKNVPTHIRISIPRSGKISIDYCTKLDNIEQFLNVPFEEFFQVPFIDFEGAFENALNDLLI